MSLESGRKLGLIGSFISVILPVISAVFTGLILFFGIFYRFSNPSSLFVPWFPTIFTSLVGIIGIVGAVLFVLGMRQLANYYNELSIYKNALYGLIISIVGSVVGFSLSALSFLGVVKLIPQTTTPSNAFPVFLQFLGLLIAFFAISFVIGIISAIFYMRAFNSLGEKSGAGNFKTAGLLYIVGAVLTIIIVGGILVWVAWIFAALGFRSLKRLPDQAFASSTPQIATPSLAQKRFCPYCGTENQVGAIFCRNCGRQLN